MSQDSIHWDRHAAALLCKLKKRERIFSRCLHRDEALASCSVMGEDGGSNVKKRRKRERAGAEKAGNAEKPAGSNWLEFVSRQGGVRQRKKTLKTTKGTSPVVVPVTGNLTRLLAIDCEMVGAGVGGSLSILARVSLVNSNGAVVYDTYVSPTHCVTDWRTRFSGIRPHHVKDAPKKSEVVEKVRRLVAGRVLLGHAIHNDLEMLEIEHPQTHVRDSARYPALMRSLPNGKLKPKKLSVLADEELGSTIQVGAHCSVEDARAVVALYKKHEQDWETWHRSTMRRQ